MRLVRLLGSVLLGTGAAITLTAAVFAVGPIVEAKIAPVLTDVTFQVIARGGDRVVLDWWGTRRRTECSMRQSAALVRRPGGEWVTATLSRSGDTSDAPLPDVTIAGGRQQLRRLDVIPDGEALIIELRYRCHPLWDTVTRLPVFEVPQ